MSPDKIYPNSVSTARSGPRIFGFTPPIIIFE